MPRSRGGQALQGVNENRLDAQEVDVVGAGVTTTPGGRILTGSIHEPNNWSDNGDHSEPEHDDEIVIERRDDAETGSDADNVDDMNDQQEDTGDKGESDDDDESDEEIAQDIYDEVMAKTMAKNATNRASKKSFESQLRAIARRQLYMYGGMYSVNNEDEVRGALHAAYKEMGYLVEDRKFKHVNEMTNAEARQYMKHLNVLVDASATFGRELRKKVNNGMNFILGEGNERPDQYLDIRNVERMLRFKNNQTNMEFAATLLEGARQDQDTFTLVHQVGEMCFMRLRGPLSQYNMVEGRELGKSITIAMETAMITQMWAYLTLETYEDRNGKDQGPTFKCGNKFYREAYHKIRKTVVEGRKDLSMDRAVARSLIHEEEEEAIEESSNTRKAKRKRDTLSPKSRRISNMMSGEAPM